MSQDRCEVTGKDQQIRRTLLLEVAVCFTFCGNGSVYAQQLDKHILEHNLTLPAYVLENKNSTSSQISQAIVPSSGQLFSLGSRIW